MLQNMASGNPDSSGSKNKGPDKIKGESSSMLEGVVERAIEFFNPISWVRSIFG